MRHSKSFLFCWNSIRFSNHYRVEIQRVIAVETQQGGVLPFLRRSSLDYLYIMLHTCLSKFMWFGWFDFAKTHMVANKSKVNAAVCLNPWSFKTSTRVFQHVIIFMPIDFGLFAYNIWILPFEIHVRCVFFCMVWMIYFCKNPQRFRFPFRHVDHFDSICLAVVEAIYSWVWISFAATSILVFHSV